MPTAQPYIRTLKAQPEPLRLPIRVPVEVELGGMIFQAEVLGSTAHVLLVQSLSETKPLPALGTLVRLKPAWDRQIVLGRLAALGTEGRFLVSLGARSIRNSRRIPVSLMGIARSNHLDSGIVVHLTDLSTGGARVQNLDLPIGSEVLLQFTPPNSSDPIDVSGFVVRSIPNANE